MYDEKLITAQLTESDFTAYITRAIQLYENGIITYFFFLKDGNNYQAYTSLHASNNLKIKIFTISSDAYANCRIYLNDHMPYKYINALCEMCCKIDFDVYNLLVGMPTDTLNNTLYKEHKIYYTVLINNSTGELINVHYGLLEPCIHELKNELAYVHKETLVNSHIIPTMQLLELI